jgi:isopentenyl-diphosphate delta-isomerase
MVDSASHYKTPPPGEGCAAKTALEDCLWSLGRADETMLEQRKADHIRINLDHEVNSSLTTGLERYRFIHQAVPELDLAQVDPATILLGKKLRAPLLISSMTGGTERAREINRRLARAAQSHGMAMGVGSQRAALFHPELADTFRVRDIAPDILLLANLGAVQLNYGYDVEHCREAVEMIGADALILHLNPLQEAVQPEGNVNFAGLLKRIEAVCRTLGVPVVAKEVGWGISEQAARQLASAGVSAIDVAGGGGTSWSEVEKHRATSHSMRRVAGRFRDWGIPTAESVLMARRGAPDLPIIASGGLRDGVDAAKCIALGASAAGIARPFLKAAAQSDEAADEAAAETIIELRIAMFAAGARNIEALRQTPLLKD